MEQPPSQLDVVKKNASEIVAASTEMKAAIDNDNPLLIKVALEKVQERSRLLSTELSRLAQYSNFMR
jgi:hypothetical protein